MTFVAAAVTTAALSLDTTVVLLTPVSWRWRRRRSLVSPRPAVYACARLANSASLLLPVSNLTNLLALPWLPSLSFAGFALVMAPVWVAVLGVEYVGHRLFFRDDLAVDAEEPARPERRRAARRTPRRGGAHAVRLRGSLAVRGRARLGRGRGCTRAGRLVAPQAARHRARARQGHPRGLRGVRAVPRGGGGGRHGLVPRRAGRARTAQRPRAARPARCGTARHRSWRTWSTTCPPRSCWSRWRRRWARRRCSPHSSGLGVGSSLTYAGSLANLLWRRTLRRHGLEASTRTFHTALRAGHAARGRHRRGRAVGLGAGRPLRPGQGVHRLSRGARRSCRPSWPARSSRPAPRVPRPAR